MGEALKLLQYHGGGFLSPIFCGGKFLATILLQYIAIFINKLIVTIKTQKILR